MEQSMAYSIKEPTFHEKFALMGTIDQIAFVHQRLLHISSQALGLLNKWVYPQTQSKSRFSWLENKRKTLSLRYILGIDDLIQVLCSRWNCMEVPAVPLTFILKELRDLYDGRKGYHIHNIIKRKLNTKFSTVAKLVAVNDALMQVLWAGPFLAG